MKKLKIGFLLGFLLLLMGCSSEHILLHNAAGDKTLEGRGQWLSEQVFEGKLSWYAKNAKIEMEGKIPLTKDYVSKAEGTNLVFHGDAYAEGTNFSFKQYQNGKLLYEGRLVDGKEEGLFRHYAEDGHILEEANFSKGKLEKVEETK